MDWHILHPSAITSSAQLTEVLLANRQITDAATFFQPPHPEDIALETVGLDRQVMDQVIDRLVMARDKQHKVVVFGDYDADGVCATTIMWEALHAVGIAALPFLPHREKHGYGLSMRALPDLMAGEVPDLVITVDNGIVAHPAITELQAQGVDVIVTDHHQLDPSLGKPTPLTMHTTQLCGTTVAWFVARELRRKTGKRWVDASLDVCAIATIADQVPLTDANRAFAVHGLKALGATQRLGLQALITVSGLAREGISAQAIGFGIAPRLNAMGRLGHSLDALRLLCTTQPERAKVLAQQLSVTNVKRQELTASMLEVARAQAADQGNHRIIVVGHPDFHEGVIGLLAGRLMEETAKPVIAAALGPQLAKASARSIKGVNIVELIRLLRSDLLELGGHPMAAGFSFATTQWEVVRTRLHTVALEHIRSTSLQPQLVVEGSLAESMVSLTTVAALKQFEPFGQGNPEPVFALPPCEVVGATTIGAEQQHLKLEVLVAEKKVVALAWNQGARLAELKVGQPIKIAAQLSSNTWKNRTNLQLIMEDFGLAVTF